ncbi:MAG: nickel-dependent lactate racemase [Atopobiaceae bacterium]|nr:nickel-dependent lactate racemase [Atopobiaceae bacterium]
MKYELGYGAKTQTLKIDDEQPLCVLEAQACEFERTGQEAVLHALKNPIASPPLTDLLQAGDSVAIITSDITRPMPSAQVMPLLLDELRLCGVADKDITLVFALGSHRKHTEQEKRHLAGERAWRDISCIDGDPCRVVHLGTTSRGTPIDIAQEVVEADKRICLGNIEYHYFAGYSGGAKAVMPGVSTPDAIQHNHRMMADERACTGNLENNPIREDIEEAAAVVGVDFILNIVLDENKNIVHAVAGDVIEAHRAGCALLDQMYRCHFASKADIVIASQGGAPKDINLYQTQKALDNAARAVTDGGIVILVGACEEGFGNERFKSWLFEAGSPGDILDRISQHFELGGHKAAAMARVMQKASIFLVSELPPDEVTNAFMVPFTSVQAAYDEAIRQQGAQASVMLIPHAGSVLPEQEA